MSKITSKEEVNKNSKGPKNISDKKDLARTIEKPDEDLKEKLTGNDKVKESDDIGIP